MLDTVKKTLSAYNMLTSSDKILVAFSGGCDSVSLCLVLMELGYDVAVAHLNHMIRKNANYDEDFVVHFATRHKLVCHTTKINIPKIAQEQKISLESAGRAQRYAYFDLLSEQYGYTKIAVAHNKNDNCETFIHNLIRGAGLGGLCGIPPVRGNIIRPIINVDRNSIEKYVSEKNETYVIDETNNDTEYTRNKIRHRLMPAFAEINPVFMDNLCKTMEIIRLDNNYLAGSVSDLVDYVNGRARIEKNKFELLDESLKAYALRLAYEKVSGTGKDFESKHISYIISAVKNKEHGKICDLCMNVMCALEYGYIVFCIDEEHNDYEYRLLQGESVFVKEADVEIITELISPDEVDYNVHNCEYFDADKMTEEIIVRNRRNGDRIIPMGMNSAKKIKDVFINEKFPPGERDTIPLICCNGIIWMYGLKRSAEYMVDKSTKRVLRIYGRK